uniref:Ribosomal protein S11 n=1 Tax=Malawimonas jakobiformis TaxID=136089 RepID=Q9G885_MALJA|nr:ribosomal protein S11 [Malawimonas jakobiformis]AAG13688.1 ribosomal protein S11 [Malawimonas jakobiformis]
MIKKINNKPNIKTINKKYKKYKICKLFVKKTQNNTFVTLTNIKGNTLVYYSTGKLGFKGAKRSTAHASEIIFQQIVKYCVSLGIKKIMLSFNGIGYNFKTYIKQLSLNKIRISSIRNNNPITYNGCRKPKVRRI